MDRNRRPTPYPLDTLPARLFPPDGSETPSTGSSASIDPYAFLSHFDTVFLIDDSANMLPYWNEVRSLLSQIAPICTERDRDGVDVYFVNHHPRGYLFYAALGQQALRSGYKHIGQATGVPGMRDNIAGIFESAKPSGKCKLDHRLSCILDEYVSTYKYHVKCYGRHLRPLNLIVITAGITHDNPVDTVIRTARALDELGAPAWQVGVQFFQVGNVEDGRQGMEYADEVLSDALDIRDMVDTVTWSGRIGELSPEALLKVVLGAMQRSIDREKI
ncbi:uncharacterized protein F4822DRAFT_444392 [Hypoxylon trugodes]|uniref:uncharacterized protein n=1 Tax=Hypoxylon trugodes TaxID=326681 RepID=UPI002196847E|nr:uncharacterized protein F4822DRAFT_444392 [Hypoxylon trugodes]KAI1387850.1 hypothetical protein F4822DRAFT_444392 [Hypoxylon trugodes]